MLSTSSVTWSRNTWATLYGRLMAGSGCGRSPVDQLTASRSQAPGASLSRSGLSHDRSLFADSGGLVPRTLRRSEAEPRSILEGIV